MPLLLLSFFAGVLTVLAPCALVMLPIVLGRGSESRGKALRVIVGLSVSVFLFTVLLKATTLFIDVPTRFWEVFSGVIVLLFGVVTLFPNLWLKFATTLKIEELASKGNSKALKTEGKVGDYLLGASLGPVFSACSPTYGLIVATVLPANYFEGSLYLLSFILGLALTLASIAIGGNSLVQKLNWSTKPDGAFRRTIGILFVLVGVLIITGLFKEVETFLIERGLYDWQTTLESSL